MRAERHRERWESWLVALVAATIGFGFGAAVMAWVIWLAVEWAAN